MKKTTETNVENSAEPSTSYNLISLAAPFMEDVAEMVRVIAAYVLLGSRIDAHYLHLKCRYQSIQ